MKSVFIIGGLLLIIALVWLVRPTSEPKVSLTTETIIGSVATAQMGLVEISSEDTTSSQDIVTTTLTTGTYQTFSSEALANSSATHNILIFSATWCPSCRSLDKDIKDNLTKIPADVALFVVDYDTNTALRQQYSVTTQHTLVLVESDGTAIKSWRGGNTLASILSNF
jgi:thioredoxin-like negative regulator of GroEL